MDSLIDRAYAAWKALVKRVPSRSHPGVKKPRKKKQTPAQRKAAEKKARNRKNQKAKMGEAEFKKKQSLLRYVSRNPDQFKQAADEESSSTTSSSSSDDEHLCEICKKRLNRAMQR